MFWLQASLIFIFSVSNDWLSVIWHEARENNKPLKSSIVAVFLGLIAWLAIIWIVDQSYWLMLPDLVGTAVGSYLGVKYHHEPLPIAIALNFRRRPDDSTG